MAKEILNIEDLLKPETLKVAIDGKYLIVPTLSDGFTGTVAGGYAYAVTKKGTDYTVNELIYNQKDNTFKPSDEPIIITDDNEIFFITRTLEDPYNYPVVATEKLKTKDVKEKQVLQAFLAFADDRFKLGVYNVFLADEPFVYGDKTE
ncbi:hypothetical protein [Enterococcus phage vB_EfaH_149]|uniref:Uncharacterized protein n=2 Tax=Kochikohdavirus TaxID=2560160 RepID=A0ACA9AT30_9CAUD|nr:virion protein [Enterococcus phage vB_Efa29212_3e]CAD0300370.1 Phage protein [Enterococcus phage 156]CAD0300398.1 hypothetical protein [Enterococcus phage vB_EfaH_149]VDB76863.1 Phage protein [Enterococcus phage 156]